MRRTSKALQDQRSNIGKKGGSSIMAISAGALVFSFISILYIFISLFGIGVANDYLFYNLQNITESMEEDGVLKEGTADRTQGYGDEFTNFNFHIDDLWLIAYITFLASSLILAYTTKKEGYFTALGYLFYIFMFILFILSIVSTITNWFNTDILEKVIPTAQLLVPKFYFYLDHLGVFTIIHLVACVIVNLVDFDFDNVFSRRKREVQALKDEERL